MYESYNMFFNFSQETKVVVGNGLIKLLRFLIIIKIFINLLGVYCIVVFV